MTPSWFTKCAVGLLVVFLVLLALPKLKCWLRCVHLAFNLPGPHPAMLSGNRMFTHSIEAINVFKSLPKLYGPLAKVWITIIPFVVISDPNYIKTVLGSTKQIDKNLIYDFLSRFFGMGLLTSSGAKWKHDRKLIQPFFHPTILRSFISSFIESSELVIKELQSREEVKITTVINNCALNVLHRSVLGISIDDYETKSKSPFTNGHIFMLSRIARPFYIFDFFYKFSSMFNTEAKQQLTFKEFAKEILDKRRQSRSKLNWCLLDYLIEISETNPEFRDEHIVDHICTFMLSGQDTVAGAITFTLYNLGKHPEVQQKVVDELEQIFEKHPKVDMDSLNQMVYLEQCIFESLRLFPSIPLISKKLVEEVQLGKVMMLWPLLTLLCQFHLTVQEEYGKFSYDNNVLSFQEGSSNQEISKVGYLEDDGLKPHAPIVFDRSKIFKVILSNHNFTAIEENTFHGFSELKFLNLEYNHISYIPERAFQELDKLLTLNLKGNKLELFRIISSSVRSLYLSKNNLKRLPNEMFSQTANIEILNLHGNYLEEIERLAFANLTQLKSLTLSNNHLKSLPEDIFLYCPEVVNLFLEDNELKVIGESFKPLKNLITLSLQNNKIEDIASGAFHTLATLNTLDLSNNSLVTLHEDLFRHLKQLGQLLLSKNKIESLPDGLFRDLDQVSRLLLNGNKIVSLQANVFRGLSDLRNLKLGHNRIGSLEKGSFSGLGVCYDLDLTGNALTVLKSDVFSGLSGLEQLILTDNKLNDIQVGAFRGLELAYIVDLENTEVQSLDGLVEMVSLHSVILRGTKFENEKVVHIGSKSFKVNVHGTWALEK